MKNFLIMVVCATAVLFSVAAGFSARQEQRLALLIGNGHYLHGGSLGNPVNDVRAMKRALEGLGFTVMKYEDCSQKTMKRAMDAFGQKLRGKDVGLFFYAGHGVQVNGHNYLIPVDAKLDGENDAEYDCVRADRVLAKMETAGSRTNIIILDACRDNPFERSWRRGAEGTGLAFMNAPSGSLIAYSTAPGQTALDGKGENSPYTSALLKQIDTPGITVIEMFQGVRSRVIAESDGKQTPWESTSLRGNFYFAGSGMGRRAGQDSARLDGTDALQREREALDAERKRMAQEKKELALLRQKSASQNRANIPQRQSGNVHKINAFRHSKGVFKRQEGGSWFEYWNDPTYAFVQQSRDGTWLYLRDDSRDIDVRFPIQGGWCQLRMGNRPWGNLYFVTPEYGSGRMITAFRHSSGVFKRQDSRKWFEYAAGPTFSFTEKSQDGLWLYLRDDSRDIDVRFPIQGGWSQLRTGNRPWGNLYFVKPE